jgi:predicted metal-dependent peptidase
MRQAAHGEIARCVIQLLRKEPFFGHLLGSVARAVDDRTPTAAVSSEGGRVTLVVNPVFFFDTLRETAERVAVIKHEALHLLLRHPFRRAPLHDPLAYNVAADLVVNQFIGPPWALPAGAVTLATFPDLNLKPDRSLEWYYERLAALAGAPAGSAPVSAEALRRLAGGPGARGDHGRWGAGTAADDLVASRQLDRIVTGARERAGASAWGALPHRLRALVDAALDRAPPALDWRRALRLFAAGARRTRLAGTTRRPSRRYGTLPGTTVRPVQRVAVVVDTSGSIDDADLTAFFAEIHAMWRHGAQVVVVECDDDVGRAYDYRGRPPRQVSGRGGTAFDPAFRWLAEASRREGRWGGCVYLTDGVGPEPVVRPPCRLLWVVTRDGRAGPHLRWGRVVRLK